MEQKLCTLLWDANKSNEKHIAVNYMGITGNTWTYKEIFSMSRQLASAYAHERYHDRKSVSKEEVFSYLRKINYR